MKLLKLEEWFAPVFILVLFAWFLGMWIYLLLGVEPPEEFYTENAQEAREAARYCERDRSSYHMTPHWRDGEDTPYAYTITCGEQR